MEPADANGDNKDISQEKKNQRWESLVEGRRGPWRKSSAALSIDSTDLKSNMWGSSLWSLLSVKSYTGT